MLGVERSVSAVSQKFLTGVENIGLSVIGDKKILTVRYKGKTISRTYDFSDDDIWDEINIDGTDYDVNIWETEKDQWNVSIHGTEEVFDHERGGNMDQIDTEVYVAIYQSVHPESFSVIDKCYISGKDIVFESKEGEGIREYDVCPVCEEHTHPDEMVTMDDDHEYEEVCSNCAKVPIQKAVTSIEDCEEMDSLYEAVVDQIKEDLSFNDITAIEELLSFVPKENLIGFLSDNRES